MTVRHEGNSRVEDSAGENKSEENIFLIALDAKKAFDKLVKGSLEYWCQLILASCLFNTFLCLANLGERENTGLHHGVGDNIS